MTASTSIDTRRPGRRVFFAGGGTGGHLYPGLAIARALVRLRPDVEPFFIGAQRGLERDILPTTEFPHVLLDLHPLYRSKVWNNAKTVRGAVGAWRELGRVAAERTPEAVIGTGGYASGLALAYAAAHRIPYALQEQNSYPGLTMRFFSRWAREVYLGYPEATRHLQKAKHGVLLDTGNPIEPPPNPRPDRAVARRIWGLPTNGGRVLLIFGGSQGARAINGAVADWLRSGARAADVYVVWATGKGTYDEFSSLAAPGVVIRPYIAPMRDAYAAADLAVARAGAMGTAELCAWGIPSLLVPLPTAAADHQSVNARTLAAAGAALYIAQADFTAARLDAALRDLFTQPDELARLAKAAAARARPNAALEIARRIAAMIDGSQLSVVGGRLSVNLDWPVPRAGLPFLPSTDNRTGLYSAAHATPGLRRPAARAFRRHCRRRNECARRAVRAPGRARHGLRCASCRRRRSAASRNRRRST